MDFESNDSDTGEHYKQLITIRNRKQKKAGGWQAMGLDHAVYKGIIKKGYRQPTPIQRKSIPLICAERDIVAMSRTGSGKTAAFVVPMLQKLKKRDTRGIRAILLSPTRELALQTFKIVKELGRYTGLFCACLIGGDNMDEQFAVLHEHPDILLATPGRLLHIVVEMNLKLTAVQYIVFDEADRLFEMGFYDQLNEIIKRLPESRQTLLFSATLPKMLIDFAKAGLSDPALVRLDVESKLSGKLNMIFAVCRQNEKLPVIVNLCRALNRLCKKTIVFCATMKHVEYIVSILREAGLDPAFLYSQLDSVARKQNIHRFRNEECPLLIVTDIAARGVDIPLLDFAVNMHFPSKPKLFVHRVGRVARAGKSGTSISFVSQDEFAYMVDLFLFIGKPMEIIDPMVTNKNNMKYHENTSLIGSIPDTLSHLETEFLLNIEQNSIEISDLRHKSENSMKKYQKTRPQPSAESVRRVKTEFKNITFGVHPFFLDPEFFPNYALNGSNDSEHQILQMIHDWRPNQAIFEIQNSLGGPGKIVDRNIQSRVPKINKIEQRKANEKAEHYVSYQPSDANTESGLAVQTNKSRNFENIAKNASVELTADDEKGLYKKTKEKVWDRKRKKFVGQPNQQVKRVRTEEGTWVPVTYKSGRYEKWKNKQKTDFQVKNVEDDMDDVGYQTKTRHFAGRNLKQSTDVHMGRSGKNELKNVDQIIKTRRKKARLQAYQDHRRKENTKKKIGSQKHSRNQTRRTESRKKQRKGGR